MKLLKELTGYQTLTPKEAIRRDKIEKAKDNFWEYCLLMNPSFFKRHRTYQKKICDTMQALYEHRLINKKTGKPYDILILNLPPGAGKSYTAALFATWCYGQNIKNAIITVSYNATLAETFAKSVRNMISDEEIKGDDDYYVPNSFWSHLKIKRGDGAMNKWSLEGSNMSYLATGFDGSITGMRGNIGIIDDPIKNAEEAVNESVKEKHWRFYKNTFASRMLDGAIQIIIQTRWATDDLAGMLSATFPERCYELKIQALETVAIKDEDGNCIKIEKSWCEDLYSTADLLQKKKTLDRDIWDANYMQEPIDKKGGLYNGGFKTYAPDMLDLSRFTRLISYTDTADTGADYLCSICCGVIDRYGYILDVYYTDDPMEVTEPETARRLGEYGIHEAIVESNNGGRGFARNVEKQLKKLSIKKCNVTWFNQSKNKKTRILVNASNVMEQLIMPEDWQSRWADFAKAIVKYQRKGKNEHDDAPDALTGVVEVINGEVKGKQYVRVGNKRRFGL